MSEVVVPAGSVATIRYMADEQGPAYPLYQRVLLEKSLRGWTWTQLQEETGLARSTFNSWKTQPQPPTSRTVNGVADKLGIGREEALRLAGVLADISDLIPECVVERVVIETEGVSDDLKRIFVRQHRDKGHSEDCQPFEDAGGGTPAAVLAG